jgi:hypothetical protein
MTKANNTEQLEKTIEEAFGLYPEDVIAPARVAADVFHQLNELFRAIKAEAEKECSISTLRIKHLAGAGAYLANDFADYTCSIFQDMAAKLNAAGIQIGESK